MTEIPPRTNGAQTVNLETPFRLGSAAADRLLCVDDMDPCTIYPTTCFSGWIMPRGRRLSEALTNDPSAPKPIIDPRIARAKCFTRAQIEEYLSSLGEPVGVALEISRIAAGMERRTAAAEAGIEAAVREAARDAVAGVKIEAQAFINDFMATSAVAIPPESYGRICGVYFLRLHGKVVYVGQSVNILARVNQHVSAGRIDFNEVEYLRCSPDDLNDYEGFFIRFLRPVENGWGSAKEHAAPTSKLWDRFSRLQFDPAFCPSYPPATLGPEAQA